MIRNFEPIRAPINCPMIITMPIDIITSPMYKKTIKAAKFVAKFNAFALAVASIKFLPLKATPLTVKKEPVPGPNIPS